MVIQDIHGNDGDVSSVLRPDVPTVDGAAKKLLQMLITHPKSSDLALTKIAGAGWVVRSTVHHMLWPRVAAAAGGTIKVTPSETSAGHMICYSVRSRDISQGTMRLYQDTYQHVERAKLENQKRRWM